MAGNGLQNPDLDFAQLYGQAKDAVPLLRSTGKNILAALKHRPGMSSVAFEMGEIKEPDRALAKILGDYRGDPKQISDITRGRFVVQNATQVRTLQKYIAENADSLGLEKTKNRFEVPSDTHFRDINMKLRMKNGHVVELRIELDDMVRVAKQTHSPYAQVQMIERRAEIEKRDMTAAEARQRAELMDTIRDMHDMTADHLGLNDLLSEEGSNKLARHAIERALRETLAHNISSTVRPEAISPTFGAQAGFFKKLAMSSALGLTTGLSPAFAQAEFYNAAVLKPPVASHESAPSAPASKPVLRASKPESSIP